jgi:hypothetical protein
MTKRTRRKIDASVKAKIALEALREQAALRIWKNDYKRASQHPSVYVIEENRLC